MVTFNNRYEISNHTSATAFRDEVSRFLHKSTARGNKDIMLDLSFEGLKSVNGNSERVLDIKINTVRIPDLKMQVRVGIRVPTSSALLVSYYQK